MTEMAGNIEGGRSRDQARRHPAHLDGLEEGTPCAVEGCSKLATTNERLRLTLGPIEIPATAYQVPLCAEHHDLLMGDVLPGVVGLGRVKP